MTWRELEEAKLNSHKRDLLVMCQDGHIGMVIRWNEGLGTVGVQVPGEDDIRSVLLAHLKHVGEGALREVPPVAAPDTNPMLSGCPRWDGKKLEMEFVSDEVLSDRQAEAVASATNETLLVQKHLSGPHEILVTVVRRLVDEVRASAMFVNWPPEKVREGPVISEPSHCGVRVVSQTGWPMKFTLFGWEVCIIRPFGPDWTRWKSTMFSEITDIELVGPECPNPGDTLCCWCGEPLTNVGIASATFDIPCPDGTMLRAPQGSVLACCKDSHVWRL